MFRRTAFCQLSHQFYLDARAYVSYGTCYLSMCCPTNCETGLIRVLLHTTLWAIASLKRYGPGSILILPTRSVSKQPYCSTTIITFSTKWKIGTFMHSLADVNMAFVTSTGFPWTLFIVHYITIASVFFFVVTANITIMSHHIANAATGTPISSCYLLQCFSFSISPWSSVLLYFASFLACMTWDFWSNLPVSSYCFLKKWFAFRLWVSDKLSGPFHSGDYVQVLSYWSVGGHFFGL